MYEKLRSLGLRCWLADFPGTHGFVAYPPQVQHCLGIATESGCEAANILITEFLKSSFGQGDFSLPGERRDDARLGMQTQKSGGVI